MKKEDALEKYAIESIPTMDWSFTKLLDDIIMCEYVDCDEQGAVKRGEIWVSADASRAIWRVAKVLLAGDKVPDFMQPGTLVMFPNDKGIPSVSNTGKRLIFLNVDRIFGVVERVTEQD